MIVTPEDAIPLQVFTYAVKENENLIFLNYQKRFCPFQNASTTITVKTASMFAATVNREPPVIKEMDTVWKGAIRSGQD